jgi:hypothetical protein
MAVKHGLITRLHVMLPLEAVTFSKNQWQAMAGNYNTTICQEGTLLNKGMLLRFLRSAMKSSRLISITMTVLDRFIRWIKCHLRRAPPLGPLMLVWTITQHQAAKITKDRTPNRWEQAASGTKASQLIPKSRTTSTSPWTRSCPRIISLLSFKNKSVKRNQKSQFRPPLKKMCIIKLVWT